MDIKSVVAIVGILAIFVLIVYLLLIMVKAIQGRKAASGIKLPAIDGYGKDVFGKPQFTQPAEFNVELVDPAEEVKQDSKEIDETEFLTALSIESRTCINPGEEAIMPKIEKMKAIEDIEMPDINDLDKEIEIEREM